MNFGGARRLFEPPAQPSPSVPTANAPAVTSARPPVASTDRSPVEPTWTIPLPAFSAAVPDLALGVLFLATWIAPTALRAQMVGYLMLLMLLEFIIMHSSAFMGNVLISNASRAGKTVGMLGLGAFYTLFVGAFSLAFHQLWPLWNFWGLMANRLLGVLIGQAPAGEEKLFIQRTWACSAVCYLVFAFATTFLPMPRFGITPEVVAHLDLPGSGLWIDQPWRVMAFGFLYFTTVGVSELFGHAWIKVSALPGQGRSASD
jgi:hypothetical protein